MAKAIFVGINYKDVQGCQDLEGLPCVYAKSMLGALTDLQGLYDKNQCLLFTDKDPCVVPGVKVDKPTKENVTKALTDMVSNAKKGDVLLFYYCGHGANEYQSSRGALKTLSSDLRRPNVIYSDQFEAIFKNLDPGISMTFLVHACFSGAMFSYHPQQTKGVALVSVGPDVPSVVRKEPDTEDFTTCIRDKVIKKLPKGRPLDPSWPTYQKVQDEVKKIVVEGKTPDGKTFKGHSELYHAPGVNPAAKKFLQ